MANKNYQCVFITTLGKEYTGSENRNYLTLYNGQEILPGLRPLLLNGCVTLGKLPNFSKLDTSKTYGED